MVIMVGKRAAPVGTILAEEVVDASTFAGLIRYAIVGLLQPTTTIPEVADISSLSVALSQDMLLEMWFRVSIEIMIKQCRDLPRA